MGRMSACVLSQLQEQGQWRFGSEGFKCLPARLPAKVCFVLWGPLKNRSLFVEVSQLVEMCCLAPAPKQGTAQQHAPYMHLSTAHRPCKSKDDEESNAMLTSVLLDSIPGMNCCVVAGRCAQQTVRLPG